MGALLQLVSSDRHSTAAGFVVKLVDKRSASHGKRPCGSMQYLDANDDDRRSNYRLRCRG
jgi:hypothetical protein